MRNRGRSSAVVAFLVGLALVVGIPRTVPARSGCSNATLRGSYAVQATGNIVSGPQAGPLAFVGAFTYDGLGQLTGNLSIRTNTATGPVSSTATYTGLYSVNADCSFEETWTNVATGGSSVHDAEVIDHGKGFYFLNITAGQPTVVSGEARKQFTGTVGDE